MNASQFITTWLMEILNVTLLWSGAVFWVLIGREAIKRAWRAWLVRRHQRRLLNAIRSQDVIWN